MSAKSIRDTEKYTFTKQDGVSGKNEWLIILIDTHSYRLEINWWNKIKCNIIHDRYVLINWAKKEENWGAAIKYILAALTGVVLLKLGCNEAVKSPHNEPIKTQKQSPTSRAIIEKKQTYSYPRIS